MKFSRLVVFLSLVGSSIHGLGEEFEGVEEVITVVATRTERSVDDVAAIVTVKTSEEIEREIAQDIADLVRFEPGVTVGGTGSRFGLSGFNIRGIGGNRVLTLIDGIRVPEEFSFGPFLSSRRDFVDIDSLSRAEIARGPISSLYGSDALGGVVALTTKSPEDMLRSSGSANEDNFDDKFAMNYKVGYSSADDSTLGGFGFVAGSSWLSGSLQYTNRTAKETENGGGVGGFGSTREQPDPQDIETNNTVVKIQISPSDNQNLMVSFDQFDNDTGTKIFSDRGVVYGVEVTNRLAKDTRERSRWSLAYDLLADLGIADSIQATIYRQNSESQQTTFDDRLSRGVPQKRIRDSFFEQEISGIFAQAGLSFDLMGSANYLTYGVDFYETSNVGLRDGSTSMVDGTPLFEFYTFPTRDFPPTDVEQLAFFVQDEIELFNGRLLLSPGLRYDSFEADVTADSVYLTGNAGAPSTEDYKDSEITGKLGAVFHLMDDLSAFARVSQGFRAPPYDDVNVGFTNFMGGYKTISSPDLESETSLGMEIGARYSGEYGQVSLTVFQNDYDDFIESLAVSPQFLASGGIDPADGLLTFQSINREKVEIDGVEMSGQLDLEAVSESFSGLSIRGSIAHADGEDKETGQPLNSVEPLSAVFGLRYRSDGERWGADLMWSLVSGKEEGDIDSDNPRIETSGYGIVDLLAYVDVTSSLSLNVGLFNLGDKVHTRWADTIGIGNDAPARFTQPGFHGGLTLRLSL